jgi:hypothetical protein
MRVRRSSTGIVALAVATDLVASGVLRVLLTGLVAALLVVAIGHAAAAAGDAAATIVETWVSSYQRVREVIATLTRRREITLPNNDDEGRH